MSDQPQPFSPEDPRLSAYLLGEMDDAERTAFEAELQSHPEAATHLEGLRETSSLLSQALEQEPAPALSAGQRSEILAAAAVANPSPSKEKAAMRKSHHWKIWGVVGTLAALGIVVAVLQRNTFREQTERVLTANQSSEEAEKNLLDSQYERHAAEAETLAELEEMQMDETIDVRNHTEAIASREATHPMRPISGGELPGLDLPRLADFPKNGALAGLGQPGAPDPSSSIRGARPAGNIAPPMNPSESEPHPFANDGKQVVATTAPQTKPGEPLPKQSPEEYARLAANSIPKAPLGWRKSDLKWDDGDWNLEFEGEAGQAGNESYEPIFENDFIPPRGEKALSTFSIDVDTASYSNMRRFIQNGQRPPVDAVRIEELVNYFHYDYAPPINGDPFSVHTEVAICPWKPEHHLVRFGLKGREIARDQRPLSNLVFLVDVSGSMSRPNKLPLVQKALTMLANEMNENDRISIVTYAGSAGVKLPSTSGEHKSQIITAIQNLRAGGSTNGEAGIHLAYNQAIQNFIQDGANRVILCTDGDFNVGVSGDNELVTIIQDKAKKSSVFLSVFGFGMGNYKDSKLEKLADKGNGHYAYIDNEREARKVFVEELTGTLYTIAKDVKIQVEFNPAHVGAYRLIGYENRILAAQDFNDDTKDAGEIGAGHTVTALYEIIPADKMPAIAQDIDRLKYQPAPEVKGNDAKPSPELLTLKLRYKQPDEDVSVKREYPVKNPGKDRKEPSVQTEWQAAVAAFGMVLRGSKHKGEADLRLVRELAMGSRGPDPSGRRREFIDLILTAEKLAAGQPLAPAQKPEEVSTEEGQKTASVKGKYQKLLKTLNVPNDLRIYGAFNDYGYWEGNTYGKHDDLPKAHWVYVYPNWYLWSETAEGKPESE